MDRKILWKFNIVDVILIAIILISIFVLIFRASTTKESDKTISYLFTYTCQSAPREAYDGLSSGMSCSDGDYGNSLGQLTALNVIDIENDSNNKSASFSTVLKAKPEEHGVSTEEVLYLKGKELKLIIGDSVFDVYLSGIQALE